MKKRNEPMFDTHLHGLPMTFNYIRPRTGDPCHVEVLVVGSRGLLRVPDCVPQGTLVTFLDPANARGSGTSEIIHAFVRGTGMIDPFAANSCQETRVLGRRP